MSLLSTSAYQIKQLCSKGMIIFSVIMMDILSGMEFDLFSPSLPDIQNQFKLTTSEVEAALSINFIGYCISLFLVGVWADRYGRKPVILGGLVIFTVGCLLCLSGISYPFLLLGRFLQGAGVAAPAILSFLIIADSYGLKKQQFYMAMLTGLQNVCIALAPIMGSYLTLYFHWKGNILLLLILGISTFLICLFYIPHNQSIIKRKTKFIKSYTFIFKSKPLFLLFLCLSFIFVPYWVFVGVSPILYMKDLGVSLYHFGFYQGTLALLFALGSLVFGLFINYFEQEKVMYFSALIFIVSIFSIGIISFIDLHNPLIITLVMINFVIGQVIPSTLLYPLSLSYAPYAKGRVAAATQAGGLVLSILGMQLAGYCYSGSFRNIGIVLIIFISLIVLTLFLLINNRTLVSPEPS